MTDSGIGRWKFPFVTNRFNMNWSVQRVQVIKSTSFYDVIMNWFGHLIPIWYYVSLLVADAGCHAKHRWSSSKVKVTIDHRLNDAFDGYRSVSLSNKTWINNLSPTVDLNVSLDGFATECDWMLLKFANHIQYFINIKLLIFIAEAHPTDKCYGNILTFRFVLQMLTINLINMQTIILYVGHHF